MAKAAAAAAAAGDDDDDDDEDEDEDGMIVDVPSVRNFLKSFLSCSLRGLPVEEGECAVKGYCGCQAAEVSVL